MHEYIPKQSRCNLKVLGICIRAMERHRTFEKHNFICVLTSYFRNKILFTIKYRSSNMEDFFHGSWKKCENQISFKTFSFLIKVRISKLVFILQEYPVKEQGLKFLSFLCCFGFLHIFCYILYQQKPKIKNNGKQFLKVYNNQKNKISRISKFLILAYTLNRKLGNLGKSSFTSICGSIKNSKFKNQKNGFKQEKWNFKIRFNKKKGTFQRFPSFQF